MNDRPLRPDATGPDRIPDRLPTYTVAEMAAMLGISTDAVRARVNRGTLEGVKVAGVWQVRPPDDLPLTDIGATDRPDPTGTRPDATGDRPDALSAHLTHLQEEISYLRTELAKRSHELATERERSDVLQRESLARIEALGASVSTPDEPPIETYRARTENAPTGILTRLRRLLGGSG